MTCIINPDDYLETASGRVWTAERGAEAWQRAFAALRNALAAEPKRTCRIVIVCGLQGAGKSTWIARQTEDPNVIYFDAALPGARHRKPVVDIALAHGVEVDAVWLRVPLATALTRNLLRRADRIVPEASIRSVDQCFEPPSIDEGFALVSIIDG